MRPANRRLQVAVLAFHKLPVQPLTSPFTQRRDLWPSWEVTHSRPRSSFQATHRAFVQHHKDRPQCGQVRKLSEGQTKSLGSREVRALRTECLSSSRASGGQIHRGLVKVWPELRECPVSVAPPFGAD